MEKYDVIVVGAGPAGSTTARVAAEAGLKVLLLEKDSFPGQTSVCGSGLSPPNLEEYDKSAREKFVEREIDSFRGCGEGEIAEIPMKNKAASISRSEFDKYNAELAVQAGAELRTNSFVNGVSKNYVFAGNQKIEGDVIVGADGTNSIVAKSLGFRPWIPEDIALNAVYEIGMSDEEIASRYGNNFYGYFSSDISPFGYGWIVPMKVSVRIGVWCRMPYLDKNIRSYLDNFVSTLGLKTNSSRYQAATFPICGPKKKTVVDNALLVGDAAGQTGPLLGEGLYYSIKIGKIAGEACTKFQEGERLGWYENAWRDRFGRIYKWELKGQKFLYKRIGVDNMHKYSKLMQSGPVLDTLQNWIDGKRDIKTRNLIASVFKSLVR